MNHVYRLVWNCSLGALVVATEIAGASGKRSTPRCKRTNARGGLRRLASVAGAVALALGQFVPLNADALPTGGQVVAGKAAIGQSGNTLTVTQASHKAILDWQRFGIGRGESVNFDQPSSSSIALNRVLGADASAIYGHLNANGQVFLVNPNGIYFAPGAQVNVGGIVASTLGISNRDFLDGHDTFSGTSTARVINDGSIITPDGGYVAFIGHQVTNDGSIRTPGGTTALGAGATVDLSFAGNRLVTYQISAAALNALAKNGGLIQASGGTVILTAQARHALLKTVVNNTGVIQAQSVQKHNGTIRLLGGHSGTTQVSGTLDASAPNAGSGGTIETSGAHLKVASTAVITTKASNGQNGHWLIDPYNFTIAASGGGITGAALSTALGHNSVTIQTGTNGASCTGATCTPSASGSNGDINVNDTVNWSANTLTLSAWRDININTAMNGSGTAGLALQYGQGAANGVININAPVNLQPGSNNFSTQFSSAALVKWTVIDSLGLSTDATTAPTIMTLQGLAATGSLTGHYVLGANINASATSNWNTNKGFTPIGKRTYGTLGTSTNNPFTGTLDGLGHTISNLSIHRPTTNSVGLFGVVVNGGVVRDIGLVGGSVSGSYDVGGLVGGNDGGTISNAYATGSVSGAGAVGGLVGGNDGGTISNAYATGSVSGSYSVGGLVEIGRAHV